MSKRVLSVGQCGPDSANLRRFIEANFDAKVAFTDDLEQTIETLQRDPADLVLVNRKLDMDYSDGLDVIRRIKADPRLSALPCMLVTNHAEHQQAAIAAGAEPGFGKLE